MIIVMPTSPHQAILVWHQPADNPSIAIAFILSGLCWTLFGLLLSVLIRKIRKELHARHEAREVRAVVDAFNDLHCSDTHGAKLAEEVVNSPEFGLRITDSNSIHRR